MREGVTRRDLIQQALAAAGVGLLPKSADAQYHPDSFLDTLRIVTQGLRDPHITAELTGGDRTTIRKIVAENTLTLPPLPHLRNSPLSPDKLFQYPIGLATAPGNGSSRKLVILGAGSAREQVDALAGMASGQYGYGNATPITSHVIITTGHVLEPLQDVSDIIILSAPQTDLGVSYIPGMQFRQEQMVSLPSGVRDADVHGQLVVIPGFDPDPTASHRKMNKMYSGIALRMTPNMAESLATLASEDPRTPRMWHWLQHSFCLVLPEGEGEKDRPTDRALRASGMSGSPVFLFSSKKKQYVFVGVFWGAGVFSHDGKRYSIGFFLGPDAVNENLKPMMGE